MIPAVILYVTQGLLAIYLYLNNWGLGISVNLFLFFYSITGVLFGIIFFGEHLSSLQYVGVILALLGVLIMNL